MRVEFKRSQTSIDLIRKALADMGVSQKSSAATAAAPAGRGPSQHAAEHDHGSDHVHGPDHGSADHKHGEDGDPTHEHGGLFGRSEERRGGKGLGSQVRYRWARDHSKKKTIRDKPR